MCSADQILVAFCRNNALIFNADTAPFRNINPWFYRQYINVNLLTLIFRQVKTISVHFITFRGDGQEILINKSILRKMEHKTEPVLFTNHSHLSEEQGPSGLSITLVLWGSACLLCLLVSSPVGVFGAEEGGWGLRPQGTLWDRVWARSPG